jgi:multiple antibiotic resistance protein
MLMTDDSLVMFAARTFAAVFVIIDPLGNVPFFIAATQNLDSRHQHAMAWRAGTVAGIVLLVFAILGSTVLRVFNVTFPAFRIGGGIVVLVIALRILSGRQFSWEDDRTFVGGSLPVRTSVVPLAIPLMAGPGAMTTVLVLSEQAVTFAHTGIILLSIAVVCLCGALCYRFAHTLQEKLGRTAIVTLSCLAGLILAVIAVQFMLDGLRQVLPHLFT